MTGNKVQLEVEGMLKCWPPCFNNSSAAALSPKAGPVKMENAQLGNINPRPRCRSRAREATSHAKGHSSSWDRFTLDY
eukprot:1157904-Pelagomonas_calceolata.AAC.3